MLVIYQKLIKREDLMANPKLLYVFGDNLRRQGFGGQAAEMRGEPNAHGIATKRLPQHGTPECYFNDVDCDIQIAVNADIKALIDRAGAYEAIVIPADGIGTGLAKLPEKAPELLAYINRCLKELELLKCN
jgi:hypothetical protein